MEHDPDEFKVICNKCGVYVYSIFIGDVEIYHKNYICDCCSGTCGPNCACKNMIPYSRGG
jgi:hypothetical protein